MSLAVLHVRRADRAVGPDWAELSRRWNEPSTSTQYYLSTSHGPKSSVGILVICQSHKSYKLAPTPLLRSVASTARFVRRRERERREKREKRRAGEVLSYPRLFFVLPPLRSCWYVPVRFHSLGFARYFVGAFWESKGIGLDLSRLNLGACVVVVVGLRLEKRN